MALVDRNVYLRNHILGVLIAHMGKMIFHGNMGSLADELTQVVLDADSKWQHKNLCQQMLEVIDSGCAS